MNGLDLGLFAKIVQGMGIINKIKNGATNKWVYVHEDIRVGTVQVNSVTIENNTSRDNDNHRSSLSYGSSLSYDNTFYIRFTPKSFSSCNY